MRTRRGPALVVVVVVAAAAALAASLFARGGEVEPYGAWVEVPSAPLGARESATVAWTGREVLVFGGSDSPPCPPNASCRPTSIPPLRDGAAFEPRTRSWRRIADAPVGFDFASGGGVRIGNIVYVLSPGSRRPGSPRAFIAYDVAADRWARLRPPPLRRRAGEYRLVAAGGRLVAVDDSGGAYSPGRTRAYDPRAGGWEVLPRDPLGKDPGRWMVGSGGRLVSFDCIPRQPDEGVCLVIAAAFDFTSRRWTRFPNSSINWQPGGWQPAGDLVVDPSLGDSNTHRQQQSKPAYPNGGILDLRARRWRNVPDRPSSEKDFGVGVLTATGASYSAAHGAVLDLARKKWWRLPRMPTNPHAGSRAAIAAGRQLFVFGGADWNDAGEYVLLDSAWIWTPPPPSRS